MTWFLLLFLAIAVLAILFQKFQATPAASFPYVSTGALFSPSERSFLGVLDSVVGDDYRVFGKVRLSDLVEPRKGLSRQQRTSALNRIQRKHLDFVVCRKHDLSVVLAIELDDKTHGRKSRQQRDDFLEKALAEAGVPLVRFPVKVQGYVLSDVRAALAEVLKVAVAAEGVRNPVVAPGVEPAQVVKKKAAIPAQEVGPACPACQSLMVKRQARKGPNEGKWFWACSTYPKCRGVVAV